MTAVDPETFLLERTALALALLDWVIDAARGGDILASWQLLADPAEIDDEAIRSAVTVALAGNLESESTPPSIDAAATPRGWWPAFSALVGSVMARLGGSADFALGAVDRPELEPVDWGSRIVLWLLGLCFATVEPFGVPRPGNQP